MDSPTFTHRHGLTCAEGFTLGKRVTMLTEAKGEDHEGIEHTLPASPVLP